MQNSGKLSAQLLIWQSFAKSDMPEFCTTEKNEPAAEPRMKHGLKGTGDGHENHKESRNRREQNEQ